MILDVHHYWHDDDRALVELQRIRHQLANISQLLTDIGGTMATQGDIDRITTKLNAVGDVIDQTKSNVDTIQQGVADLKQAIADLKSQGVDTSALEAAADRITTSAGAVQTDLASTDTTVDGPTTNPSDQ